MYFYDLSWPFEKSGCQQVETTIHTDTITEATYTSTITDAPDGVVTVYSDIDGQEYTYGASTIYEVSHIFFSRL